MKTFEVKVRGLFNDKIYPFFINALNIQDCFKILNRYRDMQILECEWYDLHRRLGLNCNWAMFVAEFGRYISMPGYVIFLSAHYVCEAESDFRGIIYENYKCELNEISLDRLEETIKKIKEAVDGFNIEYYRFLKTWSAKSQLSVREVNRAMKFRFEESENLKPRDPELDIKSLYEWHEKVKIKKRIPTKTTWYKKIINLFKIKRELTK